MKIFRTKEYCQMANPTPGEKYRGEILTEENNANLKKAIYHRGHRGKLR